MNDKSAQTNVHPRTKQTERLCVIVPCLDEAAGIGQFYQELKDVLTGLEDLECEIIFVDDGSTDGTLAELNALARRDDRVRVYSLSRNFGHQVALTAGLDVAEADAVVMMDSDLQHPPELIPRMVEAWRQGYDVVSGVRRDTRDATFWKRAASKGFYWLINRMSRTAIVPGAADFCLLSRRACRALRRMPERHRFLRGMISWMGFPRTYLPFVAPPRVAGASKYAPWRMLRFAMDAIFSFSAAPLRLAGRVGMVFAACGGLYLIYVLVRYFAVGDVVPGWASAVGVVLVLGGLQLLAIGLVGEYLARVFENTKNRPLYFFKQTPEQPAGAAPDSPEATVQEDMHS